MPCPNCEGNNRSVHLEAGDEISCKHCQAELTLRVSPLGRHWVLTKDIIEE